MTNYKVLFLLRILKNILYSFTDSFMVQYFWEVSDNTILPIALYKMVSAITIYLVIFAVRNYGKTEKRVNLMRIGVVTNFIYFAGIVILREKVVKYIYLTGIVYGLAEGFYWSIFNPLQCEGVTNEERPKFLGTSTAVCNVMSIVFPFVFGSLISSTGFVKCLLVVLVIVGLQVYLSFAYKDNGVPEGKKTNFKKYWELTKHNKKIWGMYFVDLFEGMTYSEGAFSSIVTIFILKVFSSSFSLGAFTSVFAIISTGIAILFAKAIKPKYYAPIIKVSTSFTIVALIAMFLHCNATTIILFNFFQTISRSVVGLVNSNNMANLSNIKEIEKEFKTEYWLANETALISARMIANSLFILLAFTDSMFIYAAFVVFVAMYSIMAVRLQNIIEKEG